MIELYLASELLTPLWVLFPRSEEDSGYQDLVTRALAQSSRDAEHGAAIVEHLTCTCRYRPLPADVYAAADETGKGGEHQPPPWTGTYTCECCQDTGWVAARGTENTAERCPACIRRKKPGSAVMPTAEGAA